MYQDKIIIPKCLQCCTVEWYHGYLCHPGKTHTEQTICLHFYWPQMRTTVHDVCTQCHTCQTCMKDSRKFGQLPEKITKSYPWDILCVVSYSSLCYTRESTPKSPLLLWALTMIDPATGWFKMRQITTKSADSIATCKKSINLTWLVRSPLTWHDLQEIC